MAPREPTFPELLASVKQLRSDVRVCSGVPFSKLNLRNKPDGKFELLAIGTGGGQHPTLLAGNVSADGCVLTRQYEPSSSPRPSMEQSLQAERQRTSAAGGVNQISVTPSGDVCLVEGDRFLRVDAAGCVSTPCHLGKTILDVAICPVDESLVAVTAENQVFLLHQGDEIYRSRNLSKHVLCGVPSYITQEEMERFTGMWWSPTQRWLVYEKVNEEPVEDVVVSTRQASMKYPLAGTANARSTLVMLQVKDTDDGRLRVDEYELDMQDTILPVWPWCEYLTRVGFMHDGKSVWVIIMDREQKREAVVILPVSVFENYKINHADVCTHHMTLVTDVSTEYWINTHNLTVSVPPPSDELVPWLMVHAREGDDGTYLSRITPSGEDSVPVTPSETNIAKLGGLFVDERRHLVYFFAHHSSPLDTNFCVAHLTKHVDNRQLVAQLTESDGTCRVDRAYRSAAINYDTMFAVWISGLKVPPQCVVYILHHSIDPNTLPRAERACLVDIPMATLSLLDVSPREDSPRIISYESAGFEGALRYALVLLPQSQEPAPIVQFVYGGPGVQLVRNDWAAWTVLQKYVMMGYAVIVVDGRGSDNRGPAFERSIHGKLGHVELIDQVEGLLRVVDQLRGRTDIRRVCMHGWSYGGFMSLLALAHKPDIYRCAVAGGAVVDWSLYDTAYTERYLGSSPITYGESNINSDVVKMLPDEPGRLMIAHGLQDENVHFRHVEKLIEGLIRYGKPYQLQIFPSERHGLRSLDASAHFDASMFAFMSAAFRSDPRASGYSSCPPPRRDRNNLYKQCD